jgi:hypothetical protein
VISQYFNIRLFNHWKAHLDGSDDEIDFDKVEKEDPPVKAPSEDDSEAGIRTWSSLAKQFDSD